MNPLAESSQYDELTRFAKRVLLGLALACGSAHSKLHRPSWLSAPGKHRLFVLLHNNPPGLHRRKEGREMAPMA